MKSVLITVGVLALLATAAFVAVNSTNEAELERFHIHVPKINHVIPKLHLKNIGSCLSVVTSAATSCGASYSAAGADITGDIGCVKSILNAKKCGHVF